MTDWQQQRRMLQRLELPSIKIQEGSAKPKSRNVSPLTMMAVLRAIDDRANPLCWASRETLAGDCCADRRTVTRAIKGLERLNVVNVDETSGMEITINWLAVERMQRRSAPRSHQEPKAIETAPSCDPRSHESRIQPTRAPRSHSMRPRVTSDVTQGRTECDPGSHKHQEHHLNTNNTSERSAVVAMLKDVGVVAADSAYNDAAARDWSPQYIAEIVRDFTRKHSGESWVAGRIVKILRGDRDPPIDEAEAAKRIEAQTRKPILSTTQRELVRTRIIKLGRAKGKSQAEIDDAVVAGLIREGIDEETAKSLV